MIDKRKYKKKIPTSIFKLLFVLSSLIFILIQVNNFGGTKDDPKLTTREGKRNVERLSRHVLLISS